jgi:hypothetical protein
MEMWIIIVIFLGLIAGVGTGYKLTHKKIVPLVRFVGESDKELVLREHGIHFDQTSKCSICGDTITIENIGAAIRKDGGYTFLCSKPQCMTVSDFFTALRQTSKE